MKRTIIIMSLMLAILAFGQANYKTGDVRLSPRLLNYQGYLTDTLGNPITNPSVSMTFSIYDAASSGSLKWAETQGTVSVDKGIFHALLGSVTAIPDSVFNNTDRWLELSVAGQSLMPRTRIVSVPFAYTAIYSDTAGYARNGVADNDWTYRITDGADTTLQIGGRWGLARAGAFLYGNADSTHVNFGVACSTGATGFNYKYSAVGGGYRNIAGNTYATVPGGQNNYAYGYGATVGGGTFNWATSNYSTVGGGAGNRAYNAAVVAGGNNNQATGDFAFIGGGYVNNVSGPYAAAGGGRASLVPAAYGGIFSGWNNRAGVIPDDSGATVCGGIGNAAIHKYDFVGGGYCDTAASMYSTVVGGFGNFTGNDYAFVGGGYYNKASGYYSTIGGGHSNYNAGDYSAILGGYADSIAATADYSYLFGINSNLTQDSTFMVDMPHVWYGTEANGYEFPRNRGTNGQIMITNGSGQLSWGTLGADADWTYRVTDGADTTLQTGSRWGLARAGNVLYGIYDSTHVNLGVSCTTGVSGQDYKYCTIGGGRYNSTLAAAVTVGGGESNSAYGYAATIAGGYENMCDSHYAFIGGGRRNEASGYSATVAGGDGNAAANDYASVGGGYWNAAMGYSSTVAGGDSNTANNLYTTVGGGRRNTASNLHATVAGGYCNVANQNCATVAGGYGDTASSTYATVGGGYGNKASSNYTTIAGGQYNLVSGMRAAIGGGLNNIASREFAVVCAGDSNTASSPHASVVGGHLNTANNSCAIVGGGLRNTASGTNSTVAGGYENTVTVTANGGTISGGSYHYCSGSGATIGGGASDSAKGDLSVINGGYRNATYAVYSGIGSGRGNFAGDSTIDSAAVVAGGRDNSAIDKYCFIGGGRNNSASGPFTTVGGGYADTANVDYATVAGGQNNHAGDYWATVGGGLYNYASNNYATVPGGRADTASGLYSFAANDNSTADYSNSAAFNGQATSASGQTRVGTLSKAGGTFTIDHPLDPENKILNHYFVESPDMSNMYSGSVVLDADGRTKVDLPDYFEALNKNPRVQLTGVGSSDVYVAEDIQANRFAIGGKPGMKVYWTVIADRKDPSAEIIRNIMPVEQIKVGVLAGRSLDDEFLVVTKEQLESMGKADGFRFRHASEQARYEEMKKDSK